jgi:hypothetical protein
MVSAAQNFLEVASEPAVEAPPKRLGAAGRRFWSDVQAEFKIEPHQRPVLVGACVQLDAATRAGRRASRAKSDRQRERALAAERAAWRTFMVLRRELGVDNPPSEQPRGPRLGGRY